jgi:hypothetical protein
MEYEKEQRFRENVAMGNKEKVVEMIPFVNINSKNKMNGWTALHWAYKRQHKEMIQLLMAHGAIELENNKGELPRHLGSLEYIPNYIRYKDGVPKSDSIVVSEPALVVPDPTLVVTDPALVHSKSCSTVHSEPALDDVPKPDSMVHSESDLENHVSDTNDNTCTRLMHVFSKQDHSIPVGQILIKNHVLIQDVLDQLELELNILVEHLFVLDTFCIPIHKNQYQQHFWLHFPRGFIVIQYKNK